MKTFLIYSYLRLVIMTSRIRIVAAEGDSRAILDESRPAIFTFWYRDILFFLYFFGVRRFAMMLNPKHKREAITGMAPWFGLSVAQGTIEGGGRHALVTMIERLQKGAAVALAADGSRGEPRHCKAAPFILAQETQAPIVPIAWSARFKWISRSGNSEIVVPLPFNRIEIKLGEPVQLTRHHNFNDLDDVRNRLKTLLDRITSL